MFFTRISLSILVVLTLCLFKNNVGLAQMMSPTPTPSATPSPTPSPTPDGRPVEAFSASPVSCTCSDPRCPGQTCYYTAADLATCNAECPSQATFLCDQVLGGSSTATASPTP